MFFLFGCFVDVSVCVAVCVVFSFGCFSFVFVSVFLCLVIFCFC